MSTGANLPLWRSLLFVPANEPRFVAKAHTRGANAIILDLEDSVAPDRKAAARGGLREAMVTVGQAGADVCVRINRPLDLATADIAAAVAPGVAALVVPKVMGPEHLRLLGEVVTEREAAAALPIGTTRFVTLVEDADALQRIAAIAAAPRVVALAVGGEDLATDLDAVPGADSLYVAKMLGVYAARAAGVLPLGTLGSVAGTSDDEAFRTMLRRSRGLGFACATCVHPAQIAAINEEYGPRAEAVAQARRVIEAFEAGLARGSGAVALDGRMIDLPVAERARRLLARAQSSASRQQPANAAP